jgi:hypothetical protein
VSLNQSVECVFLKGASRAYIFAWFHHEVKTAPPLKYMNSLYTKINDNLNSTVYANIPFGAVCAGCACIGRIISRSLFPAHIHFLASSCIALSTWSGVLLTFLKTQLLLSFEISQLVSMTIDLTPGLMVCCLLFPISMNNWHRSSIWLQLTGVKVGASIHVATFSHINIYHPSEATIPAHLVRLSVVYGTTGWVWCMAMHPTFRLKSYLNRHWVIMTWLLYDE